MSFSDATVAPWALPVLWTLGGLVVAVAILLLAMLVGVAAQFPSRTGGKPPGGL